MTPRRCRARVPAGLCLLALAGGPSPATGQAAGGAAARAPAEHVVLVSVDGLRPEFYLDPRWPAPNLREMAREGAHAEHVTSVFPTVTYPAHTTMITGALPARHGIHYNTPFEPEGQTGRWYWEEETVRVPTLWDAVREAGGRTASVGWPVSLGAPVDRLLPEIWPLDPEADPIEPIRRGARPPGLVEELEREATGRLTARNFTIDHLTRDDRAGAAAAYLFERYRPALLTLHLIETDHFQHLEGREGPTVPRAVAAADRAIGQVREAVERAGLLERTAFVITGDHGFVDVHTLLAPNAWLAEAGFLEDTRDRGDWRAAFHTAGGSAFLHLREPGDRAATEATRRALEALPAPVRRLFRVVERDELDRLGVDPAAALALSAAPGVAFSARADPPAIEGREGATHGHHPELPEMHTGLVAWGAGVRPGAVSPRMGLVDVAPLVAALLGLELEAPDGVLLPGLLAEP